MERNLGKKKRLLIYQVVKGTFSHPDIGHYTSYGIKIFRVSHGKLHELKTVSDVSTNEALVKQLATLCTRGQLSPIHLMDVIEDFLG